MKALFVHDHKFSNRKGYYYSPGGLPANVWNRYFDTGKIDKLIVVGRGDKGDKVEPGLIQSSIDKTEFDLLYEVKGGKEYFTKKAKLLKQMVCLIPFIPLTKING